MLFSMKIMIIITYISIFKKYASYFITSISKWNGRDACNQCLTLYWDLRNIYIICRGIYLYLAQIESA